MPILNCYVDDRTFASLKRVSAETGREIEELAEAAISDAASRAEADRLTDAGRAVPEALG